ncbi:hypothetical protein DM02DRAFT_612484 [Periconia macrospinosa]|uniref:Zn(2)-C6 fungal-type domain-containing protein n=1 Tax=Periconia macrospinosa TaxID=97972 RepID=A0A2V1DY65_9PLEO|nr:hypothetical protein DM02DRAFT_612484 [Periconia macrospinosa]
MENQTQSSSPIAKEASQQQSPILLAPQSQQQPQTQTQLSSTSNPQVLPFPKKKLRESCNHCALSKVKCSKDRPTCVRCSEKGLSCAYAPSQRTGKRRASPAGANPKRLTIKNIQLPDNPFMDFLTTSAFNFNQKTSPDLSPPTPAPKTVEMQPRIFSSGSGTVTPSDVSLMDEDGLGTDDYLSAAYMDMGMLDNDTSTFESYSEFDGVSSLLGLFNQSSFTPAACNNSHNNSVSHSSTGSGGDINTPSLEFHAQDCMSRAMGIMKGLHMAPSTCTSLISGCGAAQDIPQIDHVLTMNKEAIDAISAILNCSCSLDLQLCLYLTLITSKVIAWYRAVACGDDLTANPGGRSLATVEKVLHNQSISVGKYHLDEDGKGKLRAQLVLSELHRVMRLVDQLAKSFASLDAGSPGDNNATTGPKSSSSIGKELKGFLQSRLKNVTKETVDVLRKR